MSKPRIYPQRLLTRWTTAWSRVSPDPTLNLSWPGAEDNLRITSFHITGFRLLLNIKKKREYTEIYVVDCLLVATKDPSRESRHTSTRVQDTALGRLCSGSQGLAFAAEPPPPGLSSMPKVTVSALFEKASKLPGATFPDWGKILDMRLVKMFCDTKQKQKIMGSDWPLRNDTSPWTRATTTSHPLYQHGKDVWNS